MSNRKHRESMRREHASYMAENNNFMAETHHRSALLDNLNDQLGYSGDERLHLGRTLNAAKISSAHNAFGACDLDAFRGLEGKRVFIKHYQPSQEKKAHKEVNNLIRGREIVERIDDKGLFMKAVIPHKDGVYSAGAYGYAVVTEYQPGLVTMDHELRRLTKEEWPSAFQFMGLYAGLLHGRGIVSGDLVPKNIGQRYDYEFERIRGPQAETGVSWGQPVYFDPESSKIFDLESIGETQLQEYKALCYQDITKLLHSVVADGFMKPSDFGGASQFEEVVLQNFMSAYIYAGGLQDILDNDRHWDDIFGQVMHDKGYVAPRRPQPNRSIR